MSRRKGSVRPIAREKLAFALAGVGTLPRQNGFQSGIEDDTVDTRLSAAYAGLVA